MTIGPSMTQSWPHFGTFSERWLRAHDGRRPAVSPLLECRRSPKCGGSPIDPSQVISVSDTHRNPHPA